MNRAGEGRKTVTDHGIGMWLRSGVKSRESGRAAGWLALAAAPTFAVMPWVAANHAPPVALCASGSGFDGMTAMYLLMSVFHLPAWLKLKGD